MSSDVKIIKDHYLVIVFMVFFLALQLNTVNFGTTINNQEGVKSLKATEATVDSAPKIESRIKLENPEQWRQRFMLYSVEADELLSILALSRIDPPALKFDPQYYQYGGAWLYPLGLWFAALDKVGLISVAGLDVMLDEPDRMDNVYTWGRIFVLLAFIGSAVLLYATILRLTSPSVAAMIVGLYLFCPASLIMSQTMKPHWYGLLWINGALYVLVRSFMENDFGVKRQVVLAFFLALAVGSSATFSLFAVFIWFAMAGYVLRGHKGYGCLFLVPTVSIIIYILTNPYIFLNLDLARQEFEATSGWFEPQIGVLPIVGFVINAALPGFGIVMFIGTCAVSLWQIIRPTKPFLRWISCSVFITIIFTASMQANLWDWHLNFRYSPYFISIASLLVAGIAFRLRELTVGVVLVLTIIQGVPTMLAYMDENSPEHSTRLLAAKWIDQNVQPNSPLCLNTPTPAPFNTPPFSLSKYQINNPECTIRVHVERLPDTQGAPDGWMLITRFSPRLSNPAFPMVIGHINPQISVYGPL